MIDTTTFKYKDSRWQDIYNHLKKSGFDVYSPGVKIGECSEPYIVIKNDGSSRHESYSTNVDLYAVMCYVPKMRYSFLEVYVSQVKEVMKEIEPMIKPTGQQTPSYYDDTYKAHMISISYMNYKKI